MSLINRYLSSVFVYWHQVRDKHLHWQLARFDDVQSLRQAKALAEQTLVAQLKKQSQQLAHELAITKVQHDNALTMVKIQCKQDLRDYQDYLQALDKLKTSLKTSFSNLPEAVVYTIHHHAKQLLNKMWDAQDEQEKIKFEMQLLQFMTAVHEDSQASLQANSQHELPQRTLAFIDADVKN